MWAVSNATHTHTYTLSHWFRCENLILKKISLFLGNASSSANTSQSQQAFILHVQNQPLTHKAAVYYHQQLALQEDQGLCVWCFFLMMAAMNISQFGLTLFFFLFRHWSNTIAWSRQSGKFIGLWIWITAFDCKFGQWSSIIISYIIVDCIETVSVSTVFKSGRITIYKQQRYFIESPV